MAKFLENNKWYKKYIELAKEGKLSLPEYEENTEGEVLVKPGELFCRFPDCDKRMTEFSKTVNLRWHLKHHQDIKIADTGTGRFKQVEKDLTNTWYKNLVENNNHEADVENHESSEDHASGLDDEKPLVPWKKDLKAMNRHKLRTLAKAMGVFPCEECKTTGINCCSDFEVCTIVMKHFELKSPTELQEMGLNPTDPN